MSKQASYTTFPNVQGKTATPKIDSWSEFVGRLKSPKEYRDKQAMPLLSMCKYGKKRSAKGSLRHAGNIKAVHGIELDYDGGTVSAKTAKKRLVKAGIKAVIYTTPSHTPDSPRWRALLPLSKAVSVEQRGELVGRANRALGGILARESFTPSQSFYFGKVRGSTYEFYETRGECIDKSKLEPLYSGGNGAAGPAMFDDAPDDVFIEAYEKGEGRYNATLALTSRWISKGRDPEKVREELHKYVRLAERDGVKPVTDHGEDLHKAIDRLIASAVAKFKPEAKTVSLKEARARAKDKEREADPAEWARRVLSGEHEGRVDFKGIKGRTIPPQEWIVDKFIPRGVLTLVHGNGGVGKSRIMLMLVACVAAGQAVLGRRVEMGPVIFVSAEETKLALERQSQDIMLARKIDDGDMVKNLILISQLKGGFPMFTVKDGERSTTPAAGYFKLQELIRRVKPVMVVIENVANVFHANENARSEVEPLTGLLNELAEAHGCAVVLIGHDSKLGDYSGSSHWNNGPRHRIHVRRGGVQGPTEVKIAKTNCEVPPGSYFNAHWNDDFRCFDLGTLIIGGVLSADDAQLLRPLADAIKDGIRVSAAPKSPHNVYKVLGERSQFVKDHKRNAINKMVDGLLSKELISASDAKSDDGKGNAHAKVIQITQKGWDELYRADAIENETDDALDDDLDDLEDEPRVARKRRRKT